MVSLFNFWWWPPTFSEASAWRQVAVMATNSLILYRFLIVTFTTPELHEEATEETEQPINAWWARAAILRINIQRLSLETLVQCCNVGSTYNCSQSHDVYSSPNPKSSYALSFLKDGFAFASSTYFSFRRKSKSCAIRFREPSAWEKHRWNFARIFLQIKNASIETVRSSVVDKIFLHPLAVISLQPFLSKSMTHKTKRDGIICRFVHLSHWGTRHHCTWWYIDSISKNVFTPTGRSPLLYKIETAQL